MFRSSTPVTDVAFHDRVVELKELGRRIAALRAGAPRWLAVLGERRVGKTSMLLELVRRNRHRDVRFVVLDCFEEEPLGFELFRRLALRTVDAFFAREARVSFEALLSRPDEYRAALDDSKSYRSLDRLLRADLQGLCERPADSKLAELALGLHERLAVALGLFCVVAWDEFQEVAKLPASRGGVLTLARAVWQKHTRSTYIVCGSERTLLRKLVTSHDSPFFQHFEVMELNPMAAADAVALLRQSAPAGR
ncbi:MAG: ATP-binding protein, partial [Archangium sp.]